MSVGSCRNVRCKCADSQREAKLPGFPDFLDSRGTNQLLAMVLHFSGCIVPPVTDAWSTYDPHNSAIGIA
jgi:hypothetical protein